MPGAEENHHPAGDRVDGADRGGHARAASGAASCPLVAVPAGEDAGGSGRAAGQCGAHRHRGPGRWPACRAAARGAGTGGHFRLSACVVGEDGAGVEVAVTAALDEASGCVLTAVLHPEQQGPVELPVLLAEMAVPWPLRPGWPALLEQAHAGGPVRRLMSLPERIEATAARPAAVPETLVLGHTTAGVTSVHLAVCESLGISLEPAGPRTAGARRGALRTLQVLADLFTRHATAAARPPATAGDKNRAHEAGAGGAYWSMPQLQDLLDEWITGVWHHRPQEQLRHPLLPRAGMAPQEMWRVLLGAAGRAPLPLEGQHYGELLPGRRCAVTESGIRLGGRRYDDACLDGHRGRAHRFEVHHHQHDPRQVSSGCPTASSTRCHGRRAGTPRGPSTSCCGAAPAPSSHTAPPVAARVWMWVPTAVRARSTSPATPAPTSCSAAMRWRAKPASPWPSCRNYWTSGSPRAGSTAPTTGCATPSCPRRP